MTSHSTHHETTGKRRLMRHGLAVTGTGLICLLSAATLLIEGIAAALTLSVLAIAGLAVTLVGFGMMVVAADPFAECEAAADSEAASPEPLPPQG